MIILLIQSQQEILYNIKTMLARRIFHALNTLPRSIIVPTVSAVTQAYPFSYFNKKERERSPQQEGKIIQKGDMKQEVVREIKANTIDPELMQKLRVFSTLMSTKPLYVQEQFNAIRECVSQFPFDKLKQNSFETIKTVATFYTLAVSQGIVMYESQIPIQTAIYSAFISKIDQAKVNNNIIWSAIAQCYRVVSEFDFLVMNLHKKVPSMLGYLSKGGKDKWQYSHIILIDILHGLACRGLHMKEERTALVLIISYLDKEYKHLKENEKVSLVKQLIFANLTKRYGLSLTSEGNIFSHFLKDLQGNKFNIWTSGISTLIQNDYDSTNKYISLIDNLILHESFELLDAKGNIRNSITPQHFLMILSNYSRKYTMKKLTEAQKAKMLQFFRTQLEINLDPVMLQQYLATIINNNFFAEHYHALKLLMEHCKVQTIIPALLFEITRAGIKLNHSYFQTLEQKSDIMVNLELKKMMGKDELLVMIAARMQLQINPNNNYYQLLFNRYMATLQAMAKISFNKLLPQFLKMPQIAIYYIHKLVQIQPIFTTIGEQALDSRYMLRNIYLYLLVKYGKPQVAESSKWYDPAKVHQTVNQFFKFQLSSKEMTRYTSRNMLNFFTNYLQKQIPNPATYFKFLNVKRFMDYLIVIAQELKEGRIPYQSKIYHTYWDAVFLLMRLDITQKDLQWKLKFRQFVDTMLIMGGDHFNHTKEYRAFLTSLQQFIPKLKPHYETIAKILIVSVYNGLITHLNFHPLFQSINVSYDLKNEHKEVILLWSSSKEEQPKVESEHALIKFVNPTKEYTLTDIPTLREEAQKYELEKLCHIVELFCLPVNTQSSRIYQDLLKQLRKKPSYALTVNFVPVLNNIAKYICPFQPPEQKQNSFSNKITKEILSHCLSNFQKLTIDYHISLIKLGKTIKVHHRDYQRILLGRVLSQRWMQDVAIEVVMVLARGDFPFNFKELRAIEQSIRVSKRSWKQVYQTLNDQFLPQLRQQLSKTLTNP